MQPPERITLGDWLSLREEMRAAEALLEDVQIDPSDVATYWAISADLLALLEEIDAHLDEWRATGPGEADAPLYLGMRRRLVAILAKAEEIGITPDE